MNIESKIRRLPISDCTGAERHLIEKITKEYYTNDGVILDLGCGRGGSTFHFGKALSEMNVLPNKQIEAFNWFSNNGLSDHAFLKEFERNTSLYKPYINLYEGDITKLDWTEKPVEIIFIDIAKELYIQKSIVSKFFSSLSHKSILMHQDFGRPNLPWIHYSSGALLGFFDFITTVDDTLVLKAKAMPSSKLINKIANDDFTIFEKINFVQKWKEILGQRTATLSIPYKNVLDLSIAYIYALWGKPEDSKIIIDKFIKDTQKFTQERFSPQLNNLAILTSNK